jgi:16S rRNA A1518/A1519 N6-dimethyltransferase RsmA/KsgA/DIM1 with predicted DNA glycosylase/AP lyase activity
MIKMIRVAEPFKNMDRYEKFLKCLFSYRRKLAKNALARCCGALQDLDEDLVAYKRTYQLSPRDIVDLFRRCE